MPLPRTRLSVESLETRQCPAVTASVVARSLSVIGDGAADTVVLRGAPGGVSVNGRVFAATAFDAVVISTGGGNDLVDIGPGVAKPATVFGGSGNDRLFGGGGHDQIYGGGGNDTLDGRWGNDTLVGNSGTDAIADSLGTNSLVQGDLARGDALSAFEAQIVNLVNAERQARGLAALRVNNRLNAAANFHAGEMARLSGLIGPAAAHNHTLRGSRFPSMTDRFDYSGYAWRFAAENIAYGFTSAASVMQAWMNSAGHRANILSASATEIGVAVRADAAGRLFFAQNFGAAL